MAFGALQAWRISNMARANDNLPEPEEVAPRTKLSSKALPFQPVYGSQSLPLKKILADAYPSEKGSRPGSPKCGASREKPTRLGRFLPAPPFVPCAPPAVPYVQATDQACSPSAVMSCPQTPTLPPAKSPFSAPIFESGDAASDFAANDFEDSDADIDALLETPTGDVEYVVSDDDVVPAKATSEGASEDSIDTAIPSSDEQSLPPLSSECHQEPVPNPEGHSPGSRRSGMPVRNTFIHYSLEEEREHQMIHCSSAPGLMTEQEVHSKYPDMEPAHIRGNCRPCYYFVKKQDGCRWGGECKFCHLCPPGSLQRKKKERLKAIEAQELFEKKRLALTTQELIEC